MCAYSARIQEVQERELSCKWVYWRHKIQAHRMLRSEHLPDKYIVQVVADDDKSWAAVRPPGSFARSWTKKKREHGSRSIRS